MEKHAEAQNAPPTYTEAMVDVPPQYPMNPGYPPQGQPVQGYTQYPVYQQGYGNPPVMQYGNNVTTVIQTQPMIQGGQNTTPPQDHMCGAIFVTLCCFWPTGIIAIMKANDARCAMARGDMVSANLAAKSSKQMINISIIVGIIVLIVCGLIFGLYIGLVLTHLY
ncbi:proline-rich transmembrane protein 1-like [Haliotis rubra]|uniref:proline-rich transmembrane protein 1-like n=1 Tax=Haliotis rubra TaxID=36100 RepID=UPI001EE53357|nr:proline-rich transmembrane protein 1-like [Haliotis rubra]